MSRVLILAGEIIAAHGTFLAGCDLHANRAPRWKARGWWTATAAVIAGIYLTWR